MKPRKPIPKQSYRRKVEQRIYLKLRVEFLEQKPRCEICGKRASCDVHHKKGRYAGNYLAVDTWMALCRLCHQTLHHNPKAAREMGFII